MYIYYVCSDVSEISFWRENSNNQNPQKIIQRENSIWIHHRHHTFSEYVSGSGRFYLFIDWTCVQNSQRQENILKNQQSINIICSHTLLLGFFSGLWAKCNFFFNNIMRLCYDLWMYRKLRPKYPYKKLTHIMTADNSAFSHQKFSAENRLYLVIFLPKNEKRTFNMRVDRVC